MTDLAEGSSEIFRAGGILNEISFLKGMVTKYLTDWKVESFKSDGKISKENRNISQGGDTKNEIGSKLGCISCNKPRTQHLTCVMITSHTPDLSSNIGK